MLTVDSSYAILLQTVHHMVNILTVDSQQVATTRLSGTNKFTSRYLIGLRTPYLFMWDGVR